MSTQRRSLPRLAIVIASSLFLVGAAVAPSSASTTKDEPKEKLELFLVISPHTPAQCLSVLDDMAAKEPQILASTEWGCMAGDHTGYTMVDAKDADAAKSVVPASIRSQAKVIRLNKFTPEEIKSFHKKS